MAIKFIATCLNNEQQKACTSLGIELTTNCYAKSYGEITHGCITDFSVHCFNSKALEVFKNLGVERATLHPELNLAQIRDINKCIDTEVVIYGKIPMMVIGSLQQEFSSKNNIVDRTGASFFINGNVLYNSVPIFMADKLAEIDKTGITHGRLIFTTENYDDVRAVIKANMYRKRLKPDIEFTRGKYYSKV